MRVNDCKVVIAAVGKAQSLLLPLENLFYDSFELKRLVVETRTQLKVAENLMQEELDIKVKK